MKIAARTFLLVIVSSLFACSSDDGEITTLPIVDPSPTNDEIVLANVELVRAAAEAFASEDPRGEFPASLHATTPGGQTLIDLLPEGEMLLNPYTGAFTEPRWYSADGPGEVGFMPVELTGSGVRSSFTIMAWGEDRQIAFVDNLEDLEARAIANAEIVITAAEAWAAENDGIYPDDIGVDRNLAGKRLVDYLPDQQLLVNPFSLAASEPIDGSAAVMGETGYHSNSQNGENLGFTITATGRWDGLLIYEYRSSP